MKIELICFLYNKKLADLDIKVDDIPAKITIDTHDIETIRERGTDGENEIDPNHCMVTMKSGDSYEIDKSYNEMIKLWR